MVRDTLVLRLVVQLADWYPEEEDGPFVTVEAFAEEGKAPMIPAPLIRVPTGTPIRVTVRNALPDSTIHVIGLGSHPLRTLGPFQAIAADTVHIPAGGAREVAFRAGVPGTYGYRAVIGDNPDASEAEHEAAGGAFVVDPEGGSPPDRVFVMNAFGYPVDSTTYRNALAINGRSWPHTERLRMTVGDTLRWRVVNNTVRSHPMHLHGFYFRLDEVGTGLVSDAPPEADRMLAVTEHMFAWSTRTFTWSPDRPGNWLFHCHLTFHVIPEARLGHVHDGHAEITETTSHNPMEHMAGLVLGMEVAPRPGESYGQPGTPRRLDLYVNEGGPRGPIRKTFSYILQQGPEPSPDSVQIPGSLLVLTRGQPTEVAVHNRAREAVAIHWHGLELESWSDGVAGWSGQGSAVAPAILPGDTFVARLELPRAGTFIYHTHLNDIEQVTGGAIGPLIVMEPGERHDPDRDHVYIAGWYGLGGPPALMVNGDTTGLAPRTLRAGVPHRFRFINLGPAERVRYALRRDTTLVTWTPRAKDGADLPAPLRAPRQALQALTVGETYDFEFTPEPGDYVLTAGFSATRPTWRQRLSFR